MSVRLRGDVFWIDKRTKLVPSGRIRRPVASIAAIGKKRAKKAAEDAFALLCAQLASGTFDPASFNPKPEATGVLFEKAAELYREHRRAQGRRDVSYQQFEPWLPVFTGRMVASITSEEIEDQLATWTKERGWCPATRNRHLSMIAALFSYCYSRRWIDAHPTERGRVPRLPEENERTRWLRPSEIDKIIDAAATMAKDIPEVGNNVVNDHGKRRWLLTTFPALFRFGCMSGMRVSEICGLRRSSYQTDSNGLAFVVTEKPTKNRTFLKWPLQGEALDIVKEQLRVIPDKPTAFLFPGPWGSGSRGAVNRSFPDIVTKAGLVYGRDKRDGIVWHTTRHTMASLALNNGIPEPVVMKLGNWKSRALVARYAHLGDDTAREAAGKVASIVGSGHTAVTTVKTPSVQVSGKL
jgi:integrase